MTEVTPGSDAEHPGLELSRFLKERGLLDSTVADQGGLSRPLMSQITNGNRRITTNSAMKICRIVGGDPMYWVKRQQAHDLWLKSKALSTPQTEKTSSEVIGS